MQLLKLYMLVILEYLKSTVAFLNSQKSDIKYGKTNQFFFVSFLYFYSIFHVFNVQITILLFWRTIHNISSLNIVNITRNLTSSLLQAHFEGYFPVIA